MTGAIASVRRVRTVDRLRLVNRVGEMDDAAKDEILAALADLFTP